MPLLQLYKANQAKKVSPLDDTDLVTHLLLMCLDKWQNQYDLTENTTPVSTRALLLVLEDIEKKTESQLQCPESYHVRMADPVQLDREYHSRQY